MTDNRINPRFFVMHELDDTPCDFDLDEETLKEIGKRVDDLDYWAWCCVQVLATWTDANMVTHKGASGWVCGCSYKGPDDFRDNSGYYQDMQDEALEALLIAIEDADTGATSIWPH